MGELQRDIYVEDEFDRKNHASTASIIFVSFKVIISSPLVSGYEFIFLSISGVKNFIKGQRKP